MMSRSMTVRAALWILPALGGAVAGCRAQQQAVQEPPQPMPSGPPSTLAPAPVAATPDARPSAPAAARTPGREQVMIIEGGTERFIDAAIAAASGYTWLDLSDDFTPFIFAEHQSPEGMPLPNRYRRVFVGLANDKLDEDGQPLPAGARNYLELYGIFPSLSVLRARFLEDADRACLNDDDRAALNAVETVAYIPPAEIRREEVRVARLKRELEDARRKAKAETLAALVEQRPELAPKLKLVEKRAADKLALAAVEKRLYCEGFLKPGAHRPGIYDDAVKLAVKRFQQKHMIYESHYLRRQTVDAMARTLQENDHLSLMRVLRERVVEAAGIIEDGTVSQGPLGPVANLADEYTRLAAQQLGLDTPEGALAFFRRHGASDFARLKVAVKLPPRPAWYGPQMDLSVVIDRGDVWYDLPWDETGKRQPQPRKKYPTFTLYARHQGKRVPLIRWRTTIGGWRAEQASDGYEYFRYKGSDVGPRVIRNVVAGPVWIAPASTPIRSLTKWKLVGGKRQQVVNYAELGPGYLSAYGLVAGYFVVPGKDGRPDWDNGIRAHGSAEYLSMYSSEGFSHGCHRLPNHLAIRLYSFVLKHRPIHVVGEQSMDFKRQFLKGEEVFEIRLPSRGYAYRLDPPLPVEVLEGEIKGESKDPILGYVPKPGVRYPGPPPPVPGGPDDRAGGDATEKPSAEKGGQGADQTEAKL